LPTLCCEYSCDRTVNLPFNAEIPLAISFQSRTFMKTSARV
jgi:hypothetical protein